MPPARLSQGQSEPSSNLVKKWSVKTQYNRFFSFLDSRLAGWPGRYLQRSCHGFRGQPHHCHREHLRCRTGDRNFVCHRTRKEKHGKRKQERVIFLKIHSQNKTGIGSLIQVHLAGIDFEFNELCIQFFILMFPHSPHPFLCEFSF